jgi:hypothetical protein
MASAGVCERPLEALQSQSAEPSLLYHVPSPRIASPSVYDTYDTKYDTSFIENTPCRAKFATTHHDQNTFGLASRPQ